MSRKNIVLIFSVIFIMLGSLFIIIYNHQAYQKLPTYFTYSSSELNTLNALSSEHIMQSNDLKKWDDIVLDLIRSQALGDIYVSRLFAYLYVAQRDAAFVSYNVNASFEGSLDPISLKVVCNFFPKECKSINEKLITDEYSQKLADIIMSKVEQRMQSDARQTHDYILEDINGRWQGSAPFYGQSTGSWKTWLIKSNDQFRAPAPPSPNDPAWDEQVKMTKTALANISENQKMGVVYWAGGPGTITPPGQWLALANEYLKENSEISFQKKLLIRSVLAMGLADAVIGVFDSKYTYWARRPYMRDSNIHTVMPTPNHPSYPAAHSTISAAGATILSFYFPEKKSYWFELAHAAADSRVQGGIHFPIDNENGFAQGIKIGQYAIDAQKNITYVSEPKDSK